MTTTDDKKYGEALDSWKRVSRIVLSEAKRMGYLVPLIGELAEMGLLVVISMDEKGLDVVRYHDPGHPRAAAAQAVMNRLEEVLSKEMDEACKALGMVSPR